MHIMKNTTYSIMALCAGFALAISPAALAGEKGDWFAKADANSDGSLTLEEFKEAKGDKMDEEKVAEKFAKLDANEDGAITQDECATYCESKGKSCGIKDKDAE